MIFCLTTNRRDNLDAALMILPWLSERDTEKKMVHKKKTQYEQIILQLKPHLKTAKRRLEQKGEKKIDLVLSATAVKSKVDTLRKKGKFF